MSLLKSKSTLFYALTLLSTLAILEVSFFVGGKILQRKWGMWRVPALPAKKATTAGKMIPYQEYMELRDPVLGWPWPGQYGDDLDINGAQRNPYFPNGPQEGACVSLYGDSFTQGGDTSSLQMNWGNVLSKRLGCYVANFGMGGYGTDQAYLRFSENRNDPSPIVIFGLHPADALRNLTRIRDLENYEIWYALKPRFVLDQQGKLTLVPIPDLTEEEYWRVLTVKRPPLILEHENLQPGGPAGVVKLEFPYTISVIKNMVSFYGFRSRVLRYPGWMEFLERGHPLHALEITVGITREFVELAEKRGKAPVVVILPHPADFEYYLRKERWPYQQIIRSYEQIGIRFIDFGPYLLSVARRLGKERREYLGPTGHYNHAGNALVAQFVYDYLEEEGLVGLTEQMQLTAPR